MAVSVLVSLGYGLARDLGRGMPAPLILLAWIFLVGLVGLATVPVRRDLQLDVDLPLLLAAAFIFGPVTAGLVAFAGSFDLREIRREISIHRSLYNRAQKAISVMAAAVAFDLVGARPGQWPLAAVGGALALVADALANYAFISLGASLLHRISVSAAIGRMFVGSRLAFAISYSSFGLLGLLLSEIYLRLGLWGLAAFVLPVLLGRQTFLQERDLERVGQELRAGRRALARVSEKIGEERRDERLRIAASLHDDVLQALHSVSIHAHVIREDIRSGRLLELDSDVPGLLRASEVAAEGLRDVIRGLRESPLARRGLSDTLRLLVRQVADDSGWKFSSHIADVTASPEIELLAYQVAKEAITNAREHSGAKHVSVRLEPSPDRGSFCVQVEDDGRGFSIESVDRDHHFGLELMRERVEIAGGSFAIESIEGLGTVVSCTFPVRAR